MIESAKRCIYTLKEDPILEWDFRNSEAELPHILYYYYYYYFPFVFISWRLITLQYCSGFCHTLTWISHGSTCVPHPDPPSHLSPHPIPLGLPSAPAPSTCLMHPTWAGATHTLRRQFASLSTLQSMLSILKFFAHQFVLSFLLDFNIQNPCSSTAVFCFLFSPFILLVYPGQRGKNH